MPTPLTPLERFKKTIGHQQPDRPPIAVWLTPEVRADLEDYFERHLGNRNVEEALEVDFRSVWPVPVARDPTPPVTPPTRKPDGIYQDVVSKPLAWIETLDDVKHYQPAREPDAFDFSGLGEACGAANPFVRTFGGPGIFDLVNGLGARGRGLEDFLCDIMVGDPVAVALIDKHLASDYEYCRRALEAAGGQVEVLYIGEDCGHQQGPLFPPAFFSGFFAPRMKRFADLAHRHGAACMLHSCGSIRDLLPILIDEVGIDIHEACQPEAAGMDPEGLKRDFGDRLTFCGMLSLQETLTFGTADDCRREAEHRRRVIGADGGYIFAPANTITKDTPLRNVLAAYEVAVGRPLGI